MLTFTAAIDFIDSGIPSAEAKEMSTLLLHSGPMGTQSLSRMSLTWDGT